MKTTNNLRKIQRIFMTTVILAFLNIGVAQTYYATAGNLIIGSSIMNSGNDLEKSTLKTNENNDRSVLNDMDQNPEYWVEYLKSTVDEINFEPTTESNASPLLNQMENDAQYWLNYLKSEIENEGGILKTMESDPNYWQHYLQNTVNTDSI